MTQVTVIGALCLEWQNMNGNKRQTSRCEEASYTKS